eukprot:TRINITY_DN127439_c0_g1_i1.p1 TRINITY_DN127439_c0_g1~~TRINITY_DN127439_c0_g1_i1.p1  ORF type:complete len:301 (-),score=34.90 TRINITY_DN127439_c0_g1_i1:74-976(-)
MGTGQSYEAEYRGRDPFVGHMYRRYEPSDGTDVVKLAGETVRGLKFFGANPETASSGGFDIAAIAKEQHGQNADFIWCVFDNPCSWKVHLKSGSDVGFEFKEYAADKLKQRNITVQSKPNCAFSWTWIRPPKEWTAVPGSNFWCNWQPIFVYSGHGFPPGFEKTPLGQWERQLEYTAGYTSKRQVNLDIHFEVENKSSVELAGTGPLAGSKTTNENRVKFAADQKFALELTNTESAKYTEKLEIKLLGVPMTVYQAKAHYKVYDKTFEVLGKTLFIAHRLPNEFASDPSEATPPNKKPRN